MHFKLQSRKWDESSFTVDSWEKDYSFYEYDGISTFIYGYPFNANIPVWLNASDIYYLYKKSGTGFADDVEGVFTIIINDKKMGKCFIVTDRYGAYRMFYSNNEECIVISDLINEIVPYLPRAALNFSSILEYLNMGFKFGNKTHINGIYQFEYGSIYEIDKGLKMKRIPYWSAIDSLGSESISDDEFLEIFNSHINTAFKLEDKISLPLSGGMDSRTLLSACINNAGNIHCYTHDFGCLSHRDVKIAKRICSSLCLSHSIYKYDDDFGKKIPSMAYGYADIFNGLIPAVIYMHVINSYNNEKDKSILLLPGAMGSEVWRCYLDKNSGKSKNVDDMCSKAVDYFVNPVVTGLFKDLSREDVVSYLKSSIMDEFHKNGGYEPMFNEIFTFLGDFQNYGSVTFKVLGRYFKVFAGFAQKHLLNKVLVLQPAERSMGLMHKYIISNNCSKLLDFPLESGLFMDMDSISTIRSYTIRGFNRIKNTVLSLQQGNVFNKSYFTNYPYWFRSYHSRYLKDMLHYDHMVTGNLFDKKSLENIVALFLKGDNSCSKFIFYLLSLEIWLKKLKKAGIGL